MVREETGVQNLPLNCWYINFTLFDYIYQLSRKEIVCERKYCISNDLFIRIYFCKFTMIFCGLLLTNILKCDP